MRRFLLITFLLAAATAAADPKNPAELERAHQDMVVAQHALDEAKQRRDRHQPPPAERAAPEYFERQRTLEREVAFAQWRYDQARERWVALSGQSPSG